MDENNIKYGPLVVALLIIAIVFAALFIIMATNYKTRDKYTKLLVVSRFSNKYEAGKILDKMNNFAFRLFEYMDKKYTKPDARIIIDRLVNNYDPDFLQENDPKDLFIHKAYTTNFRTISMCLRKKDGKFYNMQTLLFVYMHELAHIASAEQKHSDHFWKTFKFILMAAVSANMYRPVDYSKKPIVYCGIDVNSSPYYDQCDMSNLI